MGLMEVQFTPIIQYVMKQADPEKEKFMRQLILIIDRQQSMFHHVRWAKTAEETAEKTLEEFYAFMQSKAKETQTSV